MFGLGSGFVLLYVGKESVDYVDGKRKAVDLSHHWISRRHARQLAYYFDRKRKAVAS